MPVFYRLHRSPNPRKDGRETPYHPRFINQQTSRMDKVIKMATSSSSFSEADITGVLRVLKNVIAIELSSGLNVELEGFGTFTVSLKCPPFCDKNQITTADVEFRTVKMRVAAELKNKVKEDFHITKAEDISRVRYRKSQRRKMLVEHIREHGYITAKEYRIDTHQYKSAAARDLKKFIEEGIIEKKGKGPGTFYMFPNNEK